MSRTTYETVIGLEIHAELDTVSKIYCGCTTAFGGEENSHCCPVCTGMPGVMPALNRRAVEYCVKAGLALNCDINRYSRQDRKHYFYPDLPKAFQTSQFDLPLCLGGYVDIQLESGEEKRIHLTRIHIEEDAGKLIHEGGQTLVDLNRCGVPLIEIVTEPEFRTAEEVRVFFEEVRKILVAVGVCNGRMQEGSLRCDVNLSVRPEGQSEFGTRTEMKNLNSFSAAYRAVEYERKRQIRVIEDGGVITQDTLRWDDAKGSSYPMRSKEDADEYFYFPEPDIMPIVFSDEDIERIRASLPELPAQKRARYQQEMKLNDYDARLISDAPDLSHLFENTVDLGTDPKQVANYILSDINRIRNEANVEGIPFGASDLAELIGMVEKGSISRSIAAKVLEYMFAGEGSPAVIVETRSLAQVSDEGAIRKMCQEVIDANPKPVSDYRGGKEKALTSLMGQVMKASKGKANPTLVNGILKDILRD